MLGQLDPVPSEAVNLDQETGLICQLWGSPEWNKRINTLTWVVKKPKESQIWFTYMKKERRGSLSRLLVLFYVQSIKHVMLWWVYHHSITFLSYITVLSILLPACELFRIHPPALGGFFYFLTLAFGNNCFSFFRATKHVLSPLPLCSYYYPWSLAHMLKSSSPPIHPLLSCYLGFHTLQFK